VRSAACVLAVVLTSMSACVGNARADAVASPSGLDCLRLSASATSVPNALTGQVAVDVFALCRVEDVIVTAPASSPNLTRKMGTLRAFTSRAAIFGRVPVGQGVLFEATYRDHRGTESATADATVPVQPQPITGEQTSAVVVAVVGVIGTLVGVALGELLGSLREKRRRRREHGRSLAQRYDAQYRSFLQSWGGAPSAEILRASLATLRREAFVPNDLTVSVEHVLAVLESSADASKQRAESQNLYQACLARLGSEAGLYPQRTCRYRKR
jgi:hypothetical protein